ncbi:MAG TPA: ABC transporter ATP-binding protein [Solirubrobacteraceae bacterium]|nr:ABC transporter ATP-binding protein [Solirubrobacteraceae bacterium]
MARVSGLHVTLTRQHEALHVLRGVDLNVKPGEVLGLVGESGSGKSILGLTLLGLLPGASHPQLRGEVVVDGVDVTAANASQLRALRRERLGAVFQDPMSSLDPTMRIGAQVIEATGSASEALRLLTAVGVPDPRRRMRSYPHELSGGLRQRVTIAIAIAGSPRLIIADEPTTALDVTVQAQILDLLSRLRAEFGCSVLLITHDLAVASQIADRIAVLYAGRVAEIADARTLLRDPEHPYTAALLRSRLELDRDKSRPLPTLDGEPPDPRHFPPGCPFSPRCVFSTPACDAALPELSGSATHRHACIRSEELDLRPTVIEVESWGQPVVDLSAKPALVAKDVVVDAGSRRGGVRILHGVDLEIRSGEAVALVGESGSGKTTLLRTVAGLMRHSGGELRMTDEAPQMVFQDPIASLTPWLSVGEMIEDRLRVTGMPRAERRQRVAEVVARVGLPPRSLGLRPSQLSGGQRQRVALARAIVVPPRLLLCDEPTSALDVSIAAAVLNLIGRLRREVSGMAVLFVTHDLAVARLIADKIAVMYLGRIVEFGPAEKVISDAVHPYTRALIDSLPHQDAEPIALVGEPPSLYSPPTGCSFHPRCPQARDGCASRAPSLVDLERHDDHVVDCVLAEA